MREPPLAEPTLRTERHQLLLELQLVHERVDVSRELRLRLELAVDPPPKPRLLTISLLLPRRAAEERRLSADVAERGTFSQAANAAP